MAKLTAVLTPNFGLYMDRPPLAEARPIDLPPRADQGRPRRAPEHGLGEVPWPAGQWAGHGHRQLFHPRRQSIADVPGDQGHLALRREQPGRRLPDTVRGDRHRRFEEGTDVADRGDEVVLGSGADAAQVRHELGESLLDRGEIGAAGRQEEEPALALLQGLSGARAFVDAEVVEDNDCAGAGRSDDGGVVLLVFVEILVEPTSL